MSLRRFPVSRVPSSLRATSLALAVGLTLACSSESEAPAKPAAKTNSTAPAAAPKAAPAAEPAAAATPEQLIARGKRVYAANCIACHNPDPRQKGGLGPDVAGSSFELLEGRVLRGEYPDGYKPKADTRVMIPLPHLENDIAALEAYLNSDLGAG